MNALTSTKLRDQCMALWKGHFASGTGTELMLQVDYHGSVFRKNTKTTIPPRSTCTI